jgi:hypothetical protein
VIFCFGGAGIEVEDEDEDEDSPESDSEPESSDSWSWFFTPLDFDFGWAVWNRFNEFGSAEVSAARSFPFPLFLLDSLGLV